MVGAEEAAAVAPIEVDAGTEVVFFTTARVGAGGDGGGDWSWGVANVHTPSLEHTTTSGSMFSKMR